MTPDSATATDAGSGYSDDGQLVATVHDADTINVEDLQVYVNAIPQSHRIALRYLAGLCERGIRATARENGMPAQTLAKAIVVVGKRSGFPRFCFSNEHRAALAEAQRARWRKRKALRQSPPAEGVVLESIATDDVR